MWGNFDTLFIYSLGQFTIKIILCGRDKVGIPISYTMPHCFAGLLEQIKILFNMIGSKIFYWTV
jgi:hypothetical protein